LGELHKLKPLQIARKLSPGRYGDGGGLYLQVGNNETKSWIFRYRVGKREREMGLGAYPATTLARAREKAAACRQLRQDGKDPIEVRDAEQRAAQAEAVRQMTFKECAEGYIADNQHAWKTKKHLTQWRNTLKRYAYPVIGHLPAREVDEPLVLQVLRPIWHTKTETATRVRGRIECVLDWAKVQKQREGENPARWRGNLAMVLPKQSDIQQVRHHPALPFERISEFLVALRMRDSSVAAYALEFLILTVGRTNEVLEGRWTEITGSGASALWVIPKERMKSERDHRVPLSAAAWAVLETVRPLAQPGDYIFPGFKRGRPLSNMALEMLIRRMNGKTQPPFWCDVNGEAIVPHGFRSTFKDWASERTSFANEISEMALAHAIEDKTEAAYRRGDLMLKRRKLMDAWARYCNARAANQDNVLQPPRIEVANSP
jgi:integrase